MNGNGKPAAPGPGPQYFSYGGPRAQHQPQPFRPQHAQHADLHKQQFQQQATSVYYGPRQPVYSMPYNLPVLLPLQQWSGSAVPRRAPPYPSYGMGVVPPQQPYSSFYQQPTPYFVPNGAPPAPIASPAPPQIHHAQPFQPPPAQQPPQPEQRKQRRPGALMVVHPDRPDHNIMEDVYNDTPAPPPPPPDQPQRPPDADGAAVKDEFRRLVHSRAQGHPTPPPQPRSTPPPAPSQTPIVSAISDSPEIVPSIGRPPPQHHHSPEPPPEPTPSPTPPPIEEPIQIPPEPAQEIPEPRPVTPEPTPPPQEPEPEPQPEPEPEPAPIETPEPIPTPEEEPAPEIEERQSPEPEIEPVEDTEPPYEPPEPQEPPYEPVEPIEPVEPLQDIVNGDDPDPELEIDPPAEDLPKDPPERKISLPILRYNYKDGQWSPLNTAGRKVYDPDFLKSLRQDPMSLKKPENLEKLELVMSEGPHRQKPHTSGNLRNDGNSFSMRNNDMLFPEFARSQGSNRGSVSGRKSQQGKSGSKNGSPSSIPGKPAIIHVSLSLKEDVKLNEAENAWKPTRFKSTPREETDDEKRESEELFKKFRSILNKLTPEKFDRLIKQILELNINSEERLKGIIDLVFEKAISEPNFALTYASLCKELKQIKGEDSKENINFRYLILTRCQREFEKASAEETASDLRMKEIEDIEDPEKRKEMRLLLEEEERKMRRRSVGNVRFIGELFKQSMLTPNIMIKCIENLINKLEEETLECLCKLITTIGKSLEDQKVNLKQYFATMQEIVQKKDKRVSSRIRFMLIDVIELRSNGWVPRQKQSNPKTMDQIQQEVELEQINKSYMGGYPSQKDDRPRDMNKRGGSKSASEEGWSSVPGRSKLKQNFTVDPGKLKFMGTKKITEIALQPSSSSLWGKGSNVNTNKKSEPMKPSGAGSIGRKSSTETSNMYHALDSMDSLDRSRDSRGKGSSMERSPFGYGESLDKIVKIIGEMNNEDANAVLERIRPHMKDVSATLTEVLLYGINRNCKKTMQTIGKLTGKLIVEKLITVEEFVTIFKQCVDKMLEVLRSDEFDCLSKFIWSHRTIHDLSIWDIRVALETLIEKGDGYKFLLSLFLDKIRDSGENYIKELWEGSSPRVRLVDWMPREKVRDFVTKVPFMDCKEEAAGPLPEEACREMLAMMRRNDNRDAVGNWIKNNLGADVKEPWFIRALTEAIYTFTLLPEESLPQPRFDPARLSTYYPLLIAYVANQEDLELQCLYAIQRLMLKLEHPHGITSQIFDHLWESGEAVSTDGFLAWESSSDPHEQEGKAVMILSLTSFFTTLKSDASSDGTTPSVVDGEANEY